MKKNIIKDSLSIKDTICKHSNTIPTMRFTEQNKAFKTEIVCVDDFGNETFREENMTVLGGALFTILKVFNAKSDLKVPTLNSQLDVNNNLSGVDISDEFVTLFGVGTGGAGDTIGSKVPVKFNESKIIDLYPLRVVNSKFDASTNPGYYMCKDFGDGYFGYYAKEFQSVTAKALYKDGVDGEDGSIVSSDVFDNIGITTPVGVFVEAALRFDRNDGREWFNYQGNVETPRINSIGLFSGCKCNLPDNTVDYKDTKLYSKFNMDNEVLQLSKGMTLYYRIYIV